MKLQNTYIKQRITFINIMLLIVLIASCMLYYMDINILKDESILLAVINLLGLLYMNYLGCPFFKYDSDGETLIFKNEKSLYPSLFVSEKQSDFPKIKLSKFVIKNRPLFKKKLEIYIFSRRIKKKQTKICFDISYLTSKQIKNLKISLNKVIKDNRECT